jgi:hypothetical protein
MARGTCTFRKRDLTQALKGARAAGIKIARCEIDREGKIVVIADNGTSRDNSKLRDWEDVR